MTGDDFCHQCFGRGWVTIDRQRVTCTCQIRLPAPTPADPKAAA